MLLFLEKLLWSVIILLAFIFCLAFHTGLTVEELYKMFREDLDGTWNKDSP